MIRVALVAALMMTLTSLIGCEAELSGGDGTSADAAPAPPPSDAAPGTDATQPPAPPPPTPTPDADVPPPTGCDWPTASLGIDTGEYLPSSISWSGFSPGSDTPASIGVEQFFDCDGSQGIHAVLFIVSQYGCGNCTREARELTGLIDGWNSQGLNIQVVTLMVDDPRDVRPATVDGARQWRDTYDLTNSYVAADPRFELVPPGRFGTPRHVIVNPRTMEVVHIRMGYTASHSELLSLARMNAAD